MADTLPPLPEPDVTAYITDSAMRSLQVRAHSDRQLEAYARAALAAVPAQPVATSARGLLADWQAAANVLFVSRSSGQYTTDTVSRDDLIQLIEAAFASAPQAVPVPAWQPIETAPKDGRKVIVSYLNRSNKPRTVMARWLTDEQAAETDGDDVGLEAGWYECIDNWNDYTEVAIHEGEPSHWMPLPAAPKEQP